MVPAVYEIPVDKSETSSGYETVQHSRLAVPNMELSNSFESSGRYDYVASTSVRYAVDSLGYEVSTNHDTNERASGVPIPGHYETDAKHKSATPPSQHYAMSYVTPIITPNRSNLEVSLGK